MAKAKRKKSAAPEAGMGRKGRLIALEGTSGPPLEEAALKLVRSLGSDKNPAGLSRFDASNTFYDLRLRKVKTMNPSPRELILLYASDLAFRVRWEITPAVQAGMCVVAAPYVHSIIGFGEALGMTRRWLTDLFSFAPEPEAVLRIKEKKKKIRKKGWRFKAADGYLEFCCASLAAGSKDFQPAEIRAAAVAYLQELEKEERCGKLGKRALRDLHAEDEEEKKEDQAEADSDDEGDEEEEDDEE